MNGPTQMVLLSIGEGLNGSCLMREDNTNVAECHLVATVFAAKNSRHNITSNFVQIRGCICAREIHLRKWRKKAGKAEQASETMHLVEKKYLTDPHI